MDEFDQKLEINEQPQEEIVEKIPGRDVYETVSSLVSALLVVVLVFTFLVRLMGVSGPSMIPTLQDGDRLLVVNSLLCGDYQVGDIVIARKETFDSKPIVKRVIATAGQTVDINENGEVVRAIDKDVLMQEISCTVVDGNEERYQFTWPDKKKSVLLANAPINKTLRPVRDDETDPTGADSEGKPYCSSGSVNFDTTENLYIEGDNLEVLKLLQETYLGKIKMIYIDPPYNTGNDFVYEDDFAQSADEYLANSGQFDEDGNRMVQNTESNGRFHTDWLNMIYPRLKLAKDLLTEDGVIFISIDDNEQGNLRKICNQVFGEQNFIAQLIWEKKFAPQNDDKYITAVHDYILTYAKHKESWSPKLQERTEEALQKFKNPDNDHRGAWTSGDLTSKTKAKGHSYAIVSPSGKEFYPPAGRQWAPAYDTYLKLRDDNRLWFGENGENVPRQKQFLSEIQSGVVPTSLLFHSECGHNQEAKKELISLLTGIGSSFETPKPIRLIRKILNLVKLESDDIILDFFSGSATTAHAVM